MYGFYGLTLLLNGICLLHALRTGRDQKWVWILLMLPVGGAMAYVLVEVVPNMSGPDLSRLPWFEKKHIARLEAELAESGTIDKRVELAELYLKYGRTADALAAVESQLDGPFRNHHHLIYLTARLRVENGLWAEAEEALTRLDGAGTSLRRRERRLLVARIRAGQGRTAEAEDLLRELARANDGEEARYRLAAFLRAAGRQADADAVVAEMVKWWKQAGGPYRRLEKPWIARARAEQAQAVKNAAVAAKHAAAAKP
jgi:hypothetical protein